MYIVFAPIPAELATAIELYRRRYDPLAKQIEPHITISKPFHFAGSPEELYDHLTEVGETHAPIKVSLAGWDVYREASYQLRLPVIAGRLEFMTLRDNLLAASLSYLAKPDETYWPHITFGQFSERSKLEQAKKALKGFEPQFVFRVTYLKLSQQEQPGYPWQERKRFGLKATVSSSRRKKKYR